MELTLSPWQENLACLFRSRQPCIFIQTVEEQRALTSLKTVVQHLAKKSSQREFHHWSCVSLTQHKLFQEVNAKPDDDGIKPYEHKPFYTVVSIFGETNTDDKKHKPIVLVLSDTAEQFKEETNIRCLREALWKIAGSSKTIILMGKPFALPEELQPYISVVPFELPTADELYSVISNIANGYKSTPGYEKVKIQDSSLRPLARACTGLTEDEARGLAGLSVAKLTAIDDRAVQLALKEKGQVVRRTNILEFRHCEGSLAQVGGLENVKLWVKQVTPMLQEEQAAREYGCKLPSGVLLLGVPGCGKSYTAQMLAAEWRLPLLIFDVGRAFGAYVGQSEANMRQMITVANACRPCIVMIDEIEKALGGKNESSDVSSRIKGQLLTWLQEKPDTVFVVATANDITKLEHTPELIRAGRFDAQFFVDLPDLRSRVEIITIHLTRLKHVMASEEIIEVAQAAIGYSGAELSATVETAVRLAFGEANRPKHPEKKHLLTALHGRAPLIQTMGEPIKRLRAWAKQVQAIPAGATLEDDMNNDSASFTDSSTKGLAILSN